MAAAYSCLPGIRPCRPSVLDFTRLTRLHLRYGRVVAPPTLSRQRRRCQPKGGFSVGGWPLPRQESHLLQRSSFRPSPIRHHLPSWTVCAWRPLCTSNAPIIRIGTSLIAPPVRWALSTSLCLSRGGPSTCHLSDTAPERGLEALEALRTRNLPCRVVALNSHLNAT